MIVRTAPPARAFEPPSAYGQPRSTYDAPPGRVTPPAGRAVIPGTLPPLVLSDRIYHRVTIPARLEATVGACNPASILPPCPRDLSNATDVAAFADAIQQAGESVRKSAPLFTVEFLEGLTVATRSVEDVRLWLDSYLLKYRSVMEAMQDEINEKNIHRYRQSTQGPKASQNDLALAVGELGWLSHLLLTAFRQRFLTSAAADAKHA